MWRPFPSGRRSLFGLGGAAVGALLLLSGCSQNSGVALARQACVHVNRSVRDFELSSKPDTTPSASAHLRAEASAELRAALPLAADATSANGLMNSLMTTISEGATVDEAHLVPALKGQCAQVNTNVNVNPEPGGNLPGS
jgi:hypothetical protein